MSNYPPRQSVLITAPAAEPLTLAEIKLFLRVDGSDEDSLIDTLTVVAREMAEKYLRRMLITQSWRMSQVYVDGQNIALVPGPVQSITSVKTELNGTQTTLDSGDYTLQLNDMLELETNPTADKIIVEFVTGYGDAEDVPAPIKQGLLHCISHLYHYREESATLSPQATALWEGYREVRV